MAQADDISLSEVSAVLLGKHQPSSTALSKLYKAVARLKREAREEAAHIQEALDAVKAQPRAADEAEKAMRGY